MRTGLWCSRFWGLWTRTQTPAWHHSERTAALMFLLSVWIWTRQQKRFVLVRQIHGTRFCEGVTWGGSGCWNSTLTRTKVSQKASRTGPEDTSVGLYLRTWSTSWSSDCSRNICVAFHRFRIGSVCSLRSNVLIGPGHRSRVRTPCWEDSRS